MSKKPSILKYLDIVTPILPAPIYWEDVNSIILGGNGPVLKATGALVREAYVGKTLYELYPKEMADHIKEHNEEVMRTGEILTQEEVIEDMTTGKIKYFMAVKAPLRDDNGNIIGIVGTSVDITAEKEAERLRLENEVHKNLAKEQEKFMKIANQVAHDIRSPLASLLMIVKSCTEIPEDDRVALREAAINIGDIANNLLSRYQKNDETASEVDERQPILVSAVLLQLLTDKKYQYKEAPIKFDYEFDQTSYFTFIKIEPSSFKRMLSNLINNAVDAFDEKEGKITLKLNATNEWVKITIQDNGKGMPPDIINKILNNIAFTEGKKAGYGIGLTQVRDTLQRNQGEMAIESKLGIETTVTITFPRIKASSWIAEAIKLRKDDIVIILDDDNSIHGAWRTHFAPILKQAPAIQLNHFTRGDEALKFINALSSDDKQKIFLLTDYELLKQELNGLHVVAKSEVKRSILVTSHYANTLVRDQAAKTNTKILPKQLASEIPIQIDESIPKSTDEIRQVDLVIIDDDEAFIKNLMRFIFRDKSVDQYQDPQHFLNNVANYAKDTKIYLDYNFPTCNLKGIDIAKTLHDQGYTKLYLLTGESFEKKDMPDYLIVIRKDDIEGIKNS